MTLTEAKKCIEELKGRFDAPFNSSDKSTIEELYYEVLGKTFKPTSCQNCYHDAVLEVYHYIKVNNRMAEKSNYRLKAGAIIHCPNFNKGKVYCNDNLTDEVASAYLEAYPEQDVLFQKIPEQAPQNNGKKPKKGSKQPPQNNGNDINDSADGDAQKGDSTE